MERVETGGPEYRIEPDCWPCIAAIAGYAHSVKVSHIDRVSLLAATLILKNN